ncbi:hypothetical protein GKE82_18530 [Conexibacter sp. W3-3-2]|uniref:hypothetical protein n=1 Tax=Conexibacter sp. W3-3-2 TaxID=2675227 RepID=UPI0012B75A6D|nr:hypothetical protein [Conexibacter sp. W3-3-2]MTD46229.1 hypothetical protein [Conexibacter sp. W3-3-2]
MPSIRTAVAVLGTSVLLGGLATPALAQEAGSYPTDTTTQQPAKKKGKKGKRHAPRLTDAQLATVAEQLGVTLEQLKTAMAEVKAAVKATEARETKAQEQALLAEKLGKTAAEVKAAFDSVRPARGEGDRRGGCKKPAAGSTTDTGTDYPTTDYPTTTTS